eukprot:scaffold6803_cov60-Cylindrotheca_fusiformis.AAC.4
MTVGHLVPPCTLGMFPPRQWDGAFEILAVRSSPITRWNSFFFWLDIDPESEMSTIENVFGVYKVKTKGRNPLFFAAATATAMMELRRMEQWYSRVRMNTMGS